MDNIDGKHYFTCITNGCPIGGSHKISENLVLLETERRLGHTITFHNKKYHYRPKFERDGEDMVLVQDFPKPKIRFHRIDNDRK